MKRLLVVALVAALVTVACGNDGTPTATTDRGSDGLGSDSVLVDVVYISHIAGSDDVANDIAELFTDRPGTTVTLHDITTAGGQAFATEQNVSDKFAVLVNGSAEHSLAGRIITLTDFPSGRGTSDVPGGGWTFDDLRQLVDSLTASGLRRAAGAATGS